MSFFFAGLLSFLLRSPMEVAACACAVFIVATIWIAVCVPEQKCRPSYSDDSHNTVPYRIYVSALNEFEFNETF